MKEAARNLLHELGRVHRTVYYDAAQSLAHDVRLGPRAAQRDEQVTEVRHAAPVDREFFERSVCLEHRNPVTLDYVPEACRAADRAHTRVALEEMWDHLDRPVDNTVAELDVFNEGDRCCRPDVVREAAALRAPPRDAQAVLLLLGTCGADCDLVDCAEDGEVDVTVLEVEGPERFPGGGWVCG